MKLLIIISDDVHRSALRQARQLGKAQALPPGVLNAPLDDEAITWIDRIWDAVEGAVYRAYREGMDAARPLIDQASGLLAELTSGLAKRAEEVRTVVGERLKLYLVNAVDGALQGVRPSLIVGGTEMRLQSLTVEQRINMSGSLKASLQEICEFVAAGELSLSAEYSDKS